MHVYNALSYRLHKGCQYNYIKGKSALKTKSYFPSKVSNTLAMQGRSHAICFYAIRSNILVIISTVGPYSIQRKFQYFLCYLIEESDDSIQRKKNGQVVYSKNTSDTQRQGFERDYWLKTIWFIAVNIICLHHSNKIIHISR